MHKRYTRWLYASLIVHFKSFIDDETVRFHYEGTERDTNVIDTDTIVLRINGPKIVEVSKDIFKASVDVNLLVQSLMQANIYRHIDLMGAMNKACFETISVSKLGPEVGDDDSVIGCLKLASDARGRERVETTNYGQLDVSVKLLQGTVEAQYEMYFE